MQVSLEENIPSVATNLVTRKIGETRKHNVDDNQRIIDEMTHNHITQKATLWIIQKSRFIL